MDSELLAELAAQAQAGDKRALEQLLRASHTPVSWLCRKLLQDDQAAEKLTRTILRSIPAQLDTLEDPAEFEKWLCRTACTRCVQTLQLQNPDDPASPAQTEKPRIPSKTLNEAQTTQMVLQLVDDLPETSRLCLLLYSCGMMGFRSIGRLLNCSKDDVLDQLNSAQKLLNVQLRKYHKMGIRFAPIASLPALLRAAMYGDPDPKAAAAMANGILGKKAPAPKPGRRGKTPTGLIIAVIAAAVLLVLMLAAILFLEVSHRAEPAETTIPTMTETTAPTETEQETTEPTVETTAETTMETTEEPTESTSAPTTEATIPAAEAASAVSGSAVSASGSSSAAASGSEIGGVYVDGCANGQHNLEPLNSMAYGKFPTCESAGWSMGICIICHQVISYEDPVTYPAKGHDYYAWKVIAPTTSSQGYTLYSCKRCNVCYEADFVDPLPAETEAPAAETGPAPESEEIT